MEANIAGSYALDAIDRTATAKANWAAVAATGGKGMTNTQIDKASKDFESTFLAQMMEHMFGDSLGDEMFGSKDTDEIYKGLMMQEYAKQMTNGGGIGIAGFVRQELLKLQEI
jgi:flagellar protein FlgJ